MRLVDILLARMVPVPMTSRPLLRAQQHSRTVSRQTRGVQQLDVSANGLGVDGGKAIAASIAENRTITSVSYQQNAFFSIFSDCLSPSPGLCFLCSSLVSSSMLLPISWAQLVVMLWPEPCLEKISNSVAAANVQQKCFLAHITRTMTMTCGAGSALKVFPHLTRKNMALSV